jgi:Mg/Co/Ni transporter MgtE
MIGIAVNTVNECKMLPPFAFCQMTAARHGIACEICADRSERNMNRNAESAFAIRVSVDVRIACGLTVAMVAWLWKGSLIVAASFFRGIVGGVVASAGIGLSVPFLLKLCRRDPQLASGPIVLSLSDIVTLLCYFNLGRWLLV